MEEPKSFQSQSKATGHEGEDEACRYITDLGYRIVKRNFTYGRIGEIDIVAMDGDQLVFIEVKARTNNLSYGKPEDAVDWRKQKQLKRSAEDAQNDFNHDRDEAINRIGQKMVQVIKDYSAQNGFTLVIDGAQVPIYYAAPELDITQAIVKRYDTANPVAEVSVPAKPAAATHTTAPTSAAKH